MSFSETEIAYIRSQPLARVATVSPDGQPDVVPVTFEFDGTHFWIGGIDPSRTRRTRNIRAGQHKVAITIDDLASVRPWHPRWIRIYGTAELVERARPRGAGLVMKVTPTTSWSLILSADEARDGSRRRAPRRTVHTGGESARSSPGTPRTPGG